MKTTILTLLLIVSYATLCHAQQRQWYNQDGLTVRQHAERVHGYSTSGMTTAQVIAENDRYHNTHGPYHGNRTSTTSRSYTNTTSTPIRSFLHRLLRR